MCKFLLWKTIFILPVMMLTGGTTQAGDVTIAVASNFAGPVKVIIAAFEQQTGHHVRLTLGSSGKVFAQINHGAPFDMFLSADKTKPAMLEKLGMTVPGSRFTYAIGTLALWSPQPGLVSEKADIFVNGKIRRLAIANPGLAPYGVAARQVLEELKLYHRLSARLVRGENIAQTYQFVATGNADAGFVALSQIQHAGGSRWIIPRRLYRAIKQDSVLMKAAKNNPAARAFCNFLQTEQARKIIRNFGYKTPEWPG